jgi:hypothetical protein
LPGFRRHIAAAMTPPYGSRHYAAGAMRFRRAIDIFFMRQTLSQPSAEPPFFDIFISSRRHQRQIFADTDFQPTAIDDTPPARR